jgi:hypothetical protein
MRNFERNDQDFKFVCLQTRKMLLTGIANLSNNNMRPFSPLSNIGSNLSSNSTPSKQFMHLCLTEGIQVRVRTIAEINKSYLALFVQCKHVGVDDRIAGHDAFLLEKLNNGEKLLKSVNAPGNSKLNSMHIYAQTGIPAALRPSFWAHLLRISVQVSDDERNYFKSLSQVENRESVADLFIQKDVQYTSDHHEYFVFQDVLMEIMMSFSRDSCIPLLVSLNFEHSCYQRSRSSTMESKFDSNPFKFSDSSRFIHSLSENNHINSANYSQTLDLNRTLDSQSNVVASKILPFHRHSMLAAPICFLHEHADDVYFVFRAMYCRYWIHLNTLSRQPDSLVYLAKQFESTLMEADSSVMIHCTRLNIHPLDIALPWICCAFSGWIEAEQLLLLWDRILGLDSLDILPLVAVAIFFFRRQSILLAESANEVKEILQELSTIKVIPLLQNFFLNVFVS